MPYNLNNLGIAYVYSEYQKEKQEKEKQEQIEKQKSQKPSSKGKPLIGGPFSLVDVDGNTVGLAFYYR